MLLPPDLDGALERAIPALGGYPVLLRYLDEVASTNDAAAELAIAGAPEGAAVLAGRQTAGRGRRGHTWYSPAGTGLYLSVVLRPGGPPGWRAAAAAPDDTRLVTLMAGVAAADAIERASGLAVALKWPNDVVVERPAAGGRHLKLGGILAEASSTGGAVQWIVLGIGINLGPTAWPPELAGRVTSIETETARPVGRGAMAAELFVALARGRMALLDDRRDEVVAQWRAHASASLGQRVRWQTAAGPREGVTHDVDESGALVVDTPAGREYLVAGEVVWL